MALDQDVFVAEFRRWRDVRGLSRSALAQRMGYSRSYVSKVESGGEHASREFAVAADTALNAGGAIRRAWRDQEAANPPKADRAPQLITPGLGAEPAGGLLWLLFANDSGRFPLYPGEATWIEYSHTVGDDKWGHWFRRAVRLPTRRLSVTLDFPTHLDPAVWGLHTSMTAESMPFATAIQVNRGENRRGRRCPSRDLRAVRSRATSGGRAHLWQGPGHRRATDRHRTHSGYRAPARAPTT